MKREANKQIDHPSRRTPIRAWWEGVYSHVYIALYPFYKIRNEIGDGYANVYSPDPQTQKQFPNALYDQKIKFRDHVKKWGEALEWAKVHAAVAPNVPKIEFYRAVWLLSCCGFQERACIKLQERIAKYCESNQILIPDDDAIPAILHPPLMRFLSSFETSNIYAWDEFRDCRHELSLSQLAPDEPTYRLPQSVTGRGLWAVHVPDPGVLVTSSLDGSDALIAMTNRARRMADPEDYFEIEHVDDSTYDDWLNPKSFFERDA